MKKFIYLAMCFAAISLVACDKENVKPEPEPDPEPQERILDDFEGEGILKWTGSNGAEFSQVDNPSKTGINTSAKCGKVVAAAAKWDFTWSTGFGATEDGSFEFLNFSNDGYLIKIMVMGPTKDSPVYLKIEGVDVPACELTTVKTTKANEWEELVFDYEPNALADGAYKNFVIIFDAGVETVGGEVWYYDNIRQCKE